MASPTLPVFRFPDSAQTIDLALDRGAFRICCHEEPLGTYNDYNSQLCNCLAIVHNLEDGLDYCDRHSREVRNA